MNPLEEEQPINLLNIIMTMLQDLVDGLRGLIIPWQGAADGMISAMNAIQNMLQAVAQAIATAPAPTITN